MGGDAVLLANYFLNRFNQEFGRNIRGFTESATMAMTGHSWPGNVRELENRLKRAVVMADGRELSVPLVWFPRLLSATPAQRSHWRRGAEPRCNTRLRISVDPAGAPHHDSLGSEAL